MLSHAFRERYVELVLEFFCYDTCPARCARIILEMLAASCFIDVAYVTHTRSSSPRCHARMPALCAMPLCFMPARAHMMRSSAMRERAEEPCPSPCLSLRVRPCFTRRFASYAIYMTAARAAMHSGGAERHHTRPPAARCSQVIEVRSAAAQRK